MVTIRNRVIINELNGRLHDENFNYRCSVACVIPLGDLVVDMKIPNNTQENQQKGVTMSSIKRTYSDYFELQLVIAEISFNE